MGLLRT